MQVMGNDIVIAQACAAGSLELNAILPLVTANLLDSIDLLTTACDILRRHCVEGIEADEDRCRRSVETSTAVVTALLPALGYEQCGRLAKEAKTQNKTIRQVVLEERLLTEAQFEQFISPEAVCRLGFVRKQREI